MSSGCSVNIRSLFQDFNPGKFLVYSCLFVFSLVFSLRQDGIVEWNYWGIFTPIWLWKLIVVSGAIVGSYIWWRHPQYRVEGEGYVHYKAMIISVALHLLLLMFELLVCDKLQNGQHLWILVFIPLIFISIISIAVCVWAVKHDRSFELELFSAVNIIQFIFLALRLDEFITWSWVIVFVPLWIMMCVALIGVLYSIILAMILIKSHDILPEQRRGNVYSAVAYTFVVVPLLIFQVMLANKLDNQNQLTYFQVSMPLLLTFVTLTCMSFGSRGGNHWWFGIRKDFCQFLLTACPLLQEYGNISYSINSNVLCNICDIGDSGDNGEQRRRRQKPEKRAAEVISKVPLEPVVSIETPD